MAFLNFLNQVPTILSGALGAFQQSKGFDIQIGASQRQAQFFRQSASATQAIAEYNIELDRQALARELDSTSRQLRRLMSTQRSQMATTGAALGSKSFLAIANASLDAVQRQVLDARNSQKIVADQRRFQAKQQAVNFQNRALAADFEAEVSMFRQRRARAGAIQSGVSTLLGSIGDLF